MKNNKKFEQICRTSGSERTTFSKRALIGVLGGFSNLGLYGSLCLLGFNSGILRRFSALSNEEGGITTSQFILGSIYSEDFDLNLKLFMKSLTRCDKNCNLKFYSIHKAYFGYKHRESLVLGNVYLMELDLDLSSYKFVGFNYKLLKEKIIDNHSDRDDYIQKEYRKDNALGEYYDEEHYTGEPDLFESLDSEVFVDVIYSPLIQSDETQSRDDSQSREDSHSDCKVPHRGTGRLGPGFPVNQRRYYSSRKRGITRELKYVKNYSASYISIIEVLNSNIDNFEKQKAIEEIIRDYAKLDIENLISKRGLDLNNFGIRVIVKQLKQLEEDFNEYFTTKAFSKYKSYFNIVKDLDKTLILSVIMSKCIPFTVKYENVDNQPVTKLFYRTGEALLLQGALYYYNNEIKMGTLSPNSNYKLRDYMIEKNIMLNEEEIIALGCDFVFFFSERSNFFEVRDVKVKKDLRKRIILPKSDLKHLLNNITFLDTEELPMIINPKPWKINTEGDIIEYGGTLSNHEYKLKSLTTPSFENPDAKFMKYNKDIICTVNKMASVKYIINKDVFDIISSKAYYKDNGEQLVLFNPHLDTEKLGKYNADKDYVKGYEITSYNSRYLYETSILNIASLLYNCEEIYFTNFIDWRGRIYTSSCSLNMQGGEIARALILFKDGEVLNEYGVNSLKIYLANAYGLDKKSKFNRLKWVNTHLDEIIASPENDLWLKADEPLIFLACALELKGYLNNPKEFISRLPILLDATCNGLQHLSGMTSDIHLAQRVNITETTIYDNPRDIYSELIPSIQNKIELLIKKDNSYLNLKYLNITRKLVKRGIMTITYGVTKRGILDQLLSEHFYISGLVDNHYVYKAKEEDKLGDVGLTIKDLDGLSGIIYNALFESHEVLNKFVIYFDSIVDMMNKLDLPIQWITPSGLKLTQRYTRFTTYDITTAIRGLKPKKTILRKPLISKKGKYVINTQKQMNAFMPNFIHSFDAAHIVLLTTKISKSYNFNIVTIHDCFGTNANYAELLSEIIKETFIAMYIDKQCIDDFHKHILNCINLSYRIDNGVVMDKEGNKIIIPEKPIIGKLEISKILPYSSTFTS